MLRPEQVAPFLMHEEVFVRDHAAKYLSKAHDPAPVTADDYWRAIDKWGLDDAASFEADLRDLPQTEYSLRRTLDALADPAIKEYCRLNLGKVIGWLPIDLAMPHREELLATDCVLQAWRDLLAVRLDLTAKPLELLWATLMQEGLETASMEESKRVAPALFHEIGRRADPATIAQAMHVVTEGTPEDWREIYAIGVLGQSRHEPAIDLIIPKLGGEDDAGPLAAVTALVRIGTVSVVEKLDAYTRSAGWSGRLFSSEVLERIKRPESESVLRRMLGDETDPGLVTQFAESLCMLCPPPDVLKELRDRAAIGRFEESGHDVEGMVLAAGQMVGYEPPDKRRLIERARRLDQQLKEIRSKFLEFSEREHRPAEVPPSPADNEITWPIHRDAPKVGRNDPCPCGSGKKHKKCCGR